MILGFLVVVEAVASALRINARHTRVAIAAFALVSVVCASYHCHREHRKGIRRGFALGTTHLIKRASTVRLVRRGLLNARPTLPKGAVLLFKGVDIWAFNRHWGPRVWYGDDTIKAFSTSALIGGSDGLYAVEFSQLVGALAGEAPGASLVRLVPEKTFAFALENGKLCQLELSGLSPTFPPSLEGSASP